MELKPGYMQTEVGVIPENWSVVPLGKLYKFSNGVNADKAAYGKGLRFINVLEPISYSHIRGPEIPGLVELPSQVAAAYTVNSGDIVFNRTSETDTELGMAAVYLGDEKVVFGGFVIRGQAISPVLDPVYAGYALRGEMVRAQIIPLGQGAVRANIGQESLRKVLVLVPPENEQRLIVEALQDIDCLLSNIQDSLYKKRQIKQAAMQELLTGKRRLPGFEGEWEVVEFGEIASIRNNRVVASTSPPGTQCVELEGIEGKGGGRLLMSTEASGKASKYSFKKGDVLFGRLRAYLRKHWLATFDGICSTEIWPLTPRDKRLFTGFLHLLVQTDDFVNAAGVSYGTHMPRTDWSVIKKFLVRLPELCEQTAIASILSDMDDELVALESHRDKTRALKHGMMQELLTGRTRLVKPA